MIGDSFFFVFVPVVLGLGLSEYYGSDDFIYIGIPSMILLFLPMVGETCNKLKMIVGRFPWAKYLLFAMTTAPFLFLVIDHFSILYVSLLTPLFGIGILAILHANIEKSD